MCGCVGVVSSVVVAGSQGGHQPCAQEEQEGVGGGVGQGREGEEGGKL